ncbi:hypothetical protein BDZ94DRAFT_1312041 [Collybia nuda]|uniref:Uncharacterized protein n=1 Tax=Collybia nuda TaxID=64659 RepID=A0A9P5XZT6_9AGAR|nr:hypothetical protein BDZ94DRAFT_1312041 [Collybia nuda]
MAHISKVEGPSNLLSQSIAISKMLVNAGEAAPVPYVKSTAGLILGILEPIKLYQRNQDDHNELIGKIGTIVTMMKDLALDPDSPPQSPKVKENLDQFINSMSSVIQDLHTTMQGYSIP